MNVAYLRMPIYTTQRCGHPGNKGNANSRLVKMQPKISGSCCIRTRHHMAE